MATTPPAQQTLDGLSGAAQSRAAALNVDVMPNLIGLPDAVAMQRLGELDVDSDWERPVSVGCETRPSTIASQEPKPGTPLDKDALVEVRSAQLDLVGGRRGPCTVHATRIGDVSDRDADVAASFYRFAADPSANVPPFATGKVWDGLGDRWLSGAQLTAPRSWRFEGPFGEYTGPFSILDVLAASGGYYEVHPGRPACASATRPTIPRTIAGLRAITITPPQDTVLSCMDWSGVTLFMDASGRIGGVLLRVGTP